MPTIDRSVMSLGTTFYSAVSTGDWSLLPGGPATGCDVDLPWGHRHLRHGPRHRRDRREGPAHRQLWRRHPARVLHARQTSFILKLHNTAQRGSLVLDEHLATVCTVQNGLIATPDTHLSEIDGMNAFFVPLATPVLAVR